jgi:NADP-dependent 3-hydroxy acid dehydrogenase YdfG
MAVLMNIQNKLSEGPLRESSLWKDKIALVTGATTGIGEAIAYSLADMGLTVAIAGRRTQQLDIVAENIRVRGAKAFPYTCDIGDVAAISAMFAAIENDAGGLHVLINNAGLGYQSSISDFVTADLRQVLDVNVLGTAICIREALKLQQHRENTAIITISSLAAHRVPPGGYGLYAASKHALRAIMEALRAELVAMKSPTKVASISPGTVATEFHKLFSRAEADPTEALEFERLTSQDIADAVVYLLSTPAHVQINDMLIRPMGQMG